MTDGDFPKVMMSDLFTMMVTPSEYRPDSHDQYDAHGYQHDDGDGVSDGEGA